MIRKASAQSEVPGTIPYFLVFCSAGFATFGILLHVTSSVRMVIASWTPTSLSTCVITPRYTKVISLRVSFLTKYSFRTLALYSFLPHQPAATTRIISMSSRRALFTFLNFIKALEEGGKEAKQMG